MKFENVILEIVLIIGLVNFKSFWMYISFFCGNQVWLATLTKLLKVLRCKFIYAWFVFPISHSIFSVEKCVLDFPACIPRAYPGSAYLIINNCRCKYEIDILFSWKLYLFVPWRIFLHNFVKTKSFSHQHNGQSVNMEQQKDNNRRVVD